jgi:hypothetical protein
MLSLRRRQVMIGGLALAALPLVSWSRAMHGKLVLSGRILGRDGKPLAGAAVVAGGARVTTDADGRFFVATTTFSRVTCNGREVEQLAAQRDAEGTWRASFALTV